MVPADSRRIPRAPRYSGYRYAMFRFVYRTFTSYGCSFQNILLTKHIQYRGPTTPPMPKQRRFGLFPGRSPLLGESLVYFLFLEVLRCFSSLGSPHLKGDAVPSARRVVPFGNPRVNGHLRLDGAYRSLSRPSSPPGAQASTMCPLLLPADL